ncbi:MAG: acyltransferase [Candidatus Symbiothrix sp.]|jgi:peptidoglycan/LPS O-acetylase OafA/YrhL|nr:acyltransferase [Candidatus Symbiothrix sp.]
MNQVMTPNTRIAFIDGLRAIAVVAVILFHFGYLPNGYLGVDVFFVISGFLITGLIYSESKEGKFSIKTFYLRRIRRIIPLVSFVTLAAVIWGLFVMLPDDLENLAESAVATTLFSNNILQAITTKDYWDIVNEFKPLMHTWSLGVEEQYYFLYPVLFLVLYGKKLKFVLPTLIALTALSLVLFFLPVFSAPAKFYYLPFRFFELSFGGITAIVMKEKMLTISKSQTVLSSLFLVILVAILACYKPMIPHSAQLLLAVLSTCMILFFTKNTNNLSNWILENKPVVFIGKISFSLYMWHQIFAAFTRYFIKSELTEADYFILLAITVMTSIGSYYLIEQPFRNKKKVTNTRLFAILIPTTLITLVLSMFLYLNAGVIKDVPELNITKSNVTRNLHAQYNDRIYGYDHEFVTQNKLKLLIIGDSFARDFANILLESNYSDTLEISYISDVNDPRIKKRMKDADLAFYSFGGKMDDNLVKIPEEQVEKVYYAGIKNFGSNNGIFYNYRGEDYYGQRTPMVHGTLELNNTLKAQWGNAYVDLIGYIVDANNEMPVFTPEHKFISQDNKHLTKAGAQYYARLLEKDKKFILNKKGIITQ